MPDLAAGIVAEMGCALVEAMAAAQDPPEDEGGSGCKNKDGTPRECTPSENFNRCMDDVQDAYDQCVAQERGLLGEIACGLGFAIDAVGCVGEGLVETVLPINKVLK